MKRPLITASAALLLAFFGSTATANPGQHHSQAEPRQQHERRHTPQRHRDHDRQFRQTQPGDNRRGNNRHAVREHNPYRDTKHRRRDHRPHSRYARPYGPRSRSHTHSRWRHDHRRHYNRYRPYHNPRAWLPPRHFHAPRYSAHHAYGVAWNHFGLNVERAWFDRGHWVLFGFSLVHGPLEVIVDSASGVLLSYHRFR